LTEIRESIKKSASDLKTSIDQDGRRRQRGNRQLRVEVSNYQVRWKKPRRSPRRCASPACAPAVVEGHIEQSLHLAAVLRAIAE